jgi:hypothetical protein
MRRKSFDVLFDTRNGMTWLADHPTMWRSLFYFVISQGAFVGVCTNVFFKEEYIGVRFAILIGILVVKAMELIVFGCFLHGLIDLCGGGSGDIRGFLCILGFTTLPYLVFTPLALVAVELGGLGLLSLPVTYFAAFLWSLYLMMRAVEAVYLLDFMRSAIVVFFAFLLWFIMLALPIYLVADLFARSFLG